MYTIITTTGIIINESPVNGAANPHECHTYTHQVLHTESFTPLQNLMDQVWFLTGDIPLDLIIDNNGLITGKIKIFDYQPSCQDNYPKETLLVNGSNWQNTGRYKNETFSFNFTVHRRYTYEDLEPMSLDPAITEPLIVIEEVTSDVTITVIKNNDIDNLIFVRKYLEAGHELKIGSDTYTNDNLDDFLARHPGPFGCKINT